MHRHAGSIHLTEQGLCAMLGYPGGKLHYFGRSENYACLGVMIEHTAMPEVSEGGQVPIVEGSTFYSYHTAFRISPKLTRREAWREVRKVLWMLYHYSRWHVSLRCPVRLVNRQRRMVAWLGKTLHLRRRQ